MKQFNVLDRNLNLHRNYLIEASAGTGKTFSIQNIVVRLLLDPQAIDNPLFLQKILVVTFTRAAVRDLKRRIRTSIEQVLNQLTTWLYQKLRVDSFPDYLEVIIEKEDSYIDACCKRLQQALFIFDEAHIFTIHSFCARTLRQYALETDVGLHCPIEDEPLPQTEIMRVIKDFFRTEVRENDYSVTQIKIFLQGDPEQKQLIKFIQGSYEFPSYPSFKEDYDEFVSIMKKIKQKFGLTSEKIIQDFNLQASFYRNHKGAESKSDTFEKISQFAKLFDQTEWSTFDFDELLNNGFIWGKALDPALLKDKQPPTHQLNYPQLTSVFIYSFQSLIDRSTSFPILLARIAADCQKLYHRYQREEERLSVDDLLVKMLSSLNQISFLKDVQTHYQAVIIDEFQDTDPIQWQIFKKLFLNTEFTWHGFIYLVGDPKQSIYSFRRADIYTYLAAANILGETSCYTLNINYRSQPYLVHALNQLFDPKHLATFIPLPKKLNSLVYHPVECSNTIENQMFMDEREAVHFFIADSSSFDKPTLNELEEKVFFPFIVQEILRLKKQKQMDESQFAVLIRDRHQGNRLANYFDKYGISYQNQRSFSLADSPSLQALIELMRALLYPQDRGIVRTALGNPLLGWNYEELTHLESMEFVMILLNHWRLSLEKNGFAIFFQEMLQMSSRPNSLTILEEILSRKDGLQFYRDLIQIGDLVSEYQHREWSGPEGIIFFLDQLKIWDENDDPRVKKMQDSSAKGVKILTLHFSKGLEFDVVFAVGLVNRTGIFEDLIPVELNEKIVLLPSSKNGEEYLRFCEENDAEKMRQLYVTLTRAKYQLYVPVILSFPSEKINFGEASPLDIYLAHLGASESPSYPDLYEMIKRNKGESFLKFLETIGKNNYITFSIHRDCIHPIISTDQLQNPISLKQPKKVDVETYPQWITSFSTIALPLAKMGKKNRISNELQKIPHDYLCENKNVHTLPASLELGILIHQIMERVNFADFKGEMNLDAALIKIHPCIENSFFHDWIKVIGKMVHNSLLFQLSLDGTDFSLSDLSSASLYREMPFIFSYKKENEIEGLEFEDGFIKGVVDLFFQFNGIYYLVDWKTNWLGPDVESYNPQFLRNAMEENSYFLQAAIYAEAIKRYLKIIEPRPFEECFGGAIYIFMRGIEAGKKTGIYHFFPQTR